MSKTQLVIIALFVEHQSPAEVAARYGIHRAWVYKLKARYEAEGEAALVGRTHARTCIILLIHDLHVRIVDTATGELLRALVINPSRDYQPTGRPPGPPRQHK